MAHAQWLQTHCQWYPKGDVRTHNSRTDSRRIFELDGFHRLITRRSISTNGKALLAHTIMKHNWNPMYHLQSVDDILSYFLWSPYGMGRPLLWSPYGIGRPYIFSCCGLFFFFLLLSFFSSPNLSRRRLDVCHTSTHGVALVRI